MKFSENFKPAAPLKRVTCGGWNDSFSSQGKGEESSRAKYVEQQDKPLHGSLQVVCQAESENVTQNTVRHSSGLWGLKLQAV